MIVVRYSLLLINIYIVNHANQRHNCPYDPHYLCRCRYYLMNLLYEVLQTDEMFSEGDSPVECFEWVLGEVLCLDVTIHADVIEDVLKIAFLL